MIKNRGTSGTAVVTFTLDEQVGAGSAVICGDWNDWSADRHVMVRGEGGFHLSVELEAGRSYRFRYLLDGVRWENDWAADDYVPNEFGGDDSVVDLTALADEVPAATGGARKSAAAPRKAAPKKAAASKQAAPPTRAAATSKKAAPAKKAAAKPATKGTKKPLK